MGKPHPLTSEYVKVGPGLYRKWHNDLKVLSTIQFNYDSNGRQISFTHRVEQPPAVVDAILDRNVALQNSWKGKFGGDLVTHTTSLPIAVHQQIMASCGFKAGQGYDEKKFRQIINDRDNYKLKTIPGRL